ncbi:MAG: hemerythrin domain-containing protein [Oceanococcaceae bacterium]
MHSFLRQLYEDHDQSRQTLQGLLRSLESATPTRAQPDAATSFGLESWMKYLDDEHHRREEHLYSYLRRVAPEAAMAVESLSRQHNELERHMVTLAALFEDAEADESGLDDNGTTAMQRLQAFRGMVENYFAHLRWEETHLFPCARQQLSAHDWDVVAANWARGNYADALATRN